MSARLKELDGQQAQHSRVKAALLAEQEAKVHLRYSRISLYSTSTASDVHGSVLDCDHLAKCMHAMHAHSMTRAVAS